MPSANALLAQLRVAASNGDVASLQQVYSELVSETLDETMFPPLIECAEIAVKVRDMLGSFNNSSSDWTWRTLH